MDKKSCFKLLFSCGFIVLAATSSTFADSTSIKREVIREDVFAAATADQFKTAYFNSNTESDKIAALSVLPMAINKFKVDAQAVIVPTWLSVILNDALNPAKPNISRIATEQIGNIGIVSYANTLITMYGQSNAAPQDRETIGLRIGIITALGNLGTPEAISLLGRIVDAHLVRPETDEALSAIGRLCAADLVPRISNYARDLENKLTQKIFVMDNPAKKPLVSPEGSLSIALSTIKMLGSGKCGK